MGFQVPSPRVSGRDQNALLLIPWTESLFAFARMWERLADAVHIVAIDLPGFGHSERRDDLLSPRATGVFPGRVADAFGLEDRMYSGTLWLRRCGLARWQQAGT